MAKRFAVAEAEVDALRLSLDYDAAYKAVRSWKSHYAQTGQVSAGHPTSQLFEALRLTVQAEYHLSRGNDNDCRTYLQRALVASPTYADALIVTCKFCLSRGLWPPLDQAGRSHPKAQASLSKALNPLLGGTAAARVPTLSSLVTLSSSTPASSPSWPPDILLLLVDIITNRLQEGAQACSQYRILLRIQACTLLCEVCAAHPALVHSACLAPYSPVWALACTVRADEGSTGTGTGSGTGSGTGAGTPADSLQPEQVAAWVATGAVDAAWKLLKTVAKLSPPPSPSPFGLSLLVDLPPALLYSTQAWGVGEAMDAQRALCAALTLSWTKVKEASGAVGAPGPDGRSDPLSLVLSVLHPQVQSHWARLASALPTLLHTCGERTEAFHAALVALHPRLGAHSAAATVARTIGRLAASLSGSSWGAAGAGAAAGVGSGEGSQAGPAGSDSAARLAIMACLAGLQVAPQDVALWSGFAAAMSHYLLSTAARAAGAAGQADGKPLLCLPRPAPAAHIQAGCTSLLSALQHMRALPGEGEDADRLTMISEQACVALLACGCPPAWALSCTPSPMSVPVASEGVRSKESRVRAANAVACAHVLLAEEAMSDRAFTVSILTPTLSSACCVPCLYPASGGGSNGAGGVKAAREAWGQISAWLQAEFTGAQDAEEGVEETPRPKLPFDSSESPTSPVPLPRAAPVPTEQASYSPQHSSSHALWPVLYNQARVALCAGDVTAASHDSRTCLTLILSSANASSPGGEGRGVGMDLPWALATLVAAQQYGPAQAGVVLLPGLTKYPNSPILRLCEARIAECLCVSGMTGQDSAGRGEGVPRADLRQAMDGISLLSMYQDIADTLEREGQGSAGADSAPILAMQLGIPGGLAGPIVSCDGGGGGSPASWRVRLAAAVYGHCARVAASEGLLEAAHAAVVACQEFLIREQWQGRGASQKRATVPALGEGEGMAADVPLSEGHPAFIGQGTCSSPTVQADILAMTGMLHESVGAVSSAQAQYLAALALVPAHVPVLLQLAVTTLAQAWEAVQGEGDDLTAAARAAKVSPHALSDALALAHRSRSYCMRAVRSDPGCAHAWHTLSRIAGALGEQEAALEAAEQAVASKGPVVLLPPTLLPLLL